MNTAKRNSYGKIVLLLVLAFLVSEPAFAKKKKKPKTKQPAIAVNKSKAKKDSVTREVTPFDLDLGNRKDVDKLLDFAYGQLGTPYKYASADPKKGGLDCSGFVYYVFTHFKMKVPRSSKDYMNFGQTVDMKDARKGDVIVFTGTDASSKIGGHVGIITDIKRKDLSFIHGSSGKAQGVIVSKLSEGYYSQRFLKIVRVLHD